MDTPFLETQHITSEAQDTEWLRPVMFTHVAIVHFVVTLSLAASSYRVAITDAIVYGSPW